MAEQEIVKSGSYIVYLKTINQLLNKFMHW